MFRRTFFAACFLVAAVFAVPQPQTHPTFYPAAQGDFDGANDFLSHAGDLTGMGDSKAGTLSVWIRIDGGDGLSRGILFNEGYYFYLMLNVTNKVVIHGEDVGGTTRMHLESTAPILAGDLGEWHHLLFSWFLTSGRLYCHIDDVLDAGVGVIKQNATLDLTRNGWAIGAAVDTANKFDGAIAELYFYAGTYLNTTVEANRRHWIDGGGWPVNIGPTGALALGTAPHIYMKNAYYDCGTNSGDGGDFVINGAPIYTPGPSRAPWWFKVPPMEYLH